MEVGESCFVILGAVSLKISMISTLDRSLTKLRNYLLIPCMYSSSARVTETSSLNGAYDTHRMVFVERVYPSIFNSLD